MNIWRTVVVLLAGMVLSAHAAILSTDGTELDVEAKIASAVEGVDEVQVPAGTYTWVSIAVNKNIVLRGAGSGSTIINISASAPLNANGGCVTLSGSGATLASLKLVQSGSAQTTAIYASGANWWADDVIIQGAATDGYSIYASAYGLISASRIVTVAANDEYLFVRGPSDSWQTDHSKGTINAVIMEDCIIEGPGYTDFNSNARGVVRLNTFAGSGKVDGHGIASNVPVRGVRQMEIILNRWTYTAGSGWTAIELRGGTGEIWGNYASGSASTSAFFLDDYGYLGQYGAFNSVYQTPNSYPIGDQIGTGKDVTINATAITAYKLVRIASTSDGLGGSTTNYTLIGAPNNNLGTQFIANGAGAGTGTVTTSPAAAEPAYLWKNIRAGVAWARNYKTAAAGAIALYESSFNDYHLIWPDRDFFSDSGFSATFTFDGDEGMGVGTRAQMDAIAVNGVTKLIGVGFWVIDEGNWNKTFAGPKTAAEIVAGDLCEIVATGSTSFTAIGAPSDSVGTYFKATGAGSGSGTVRPAQGRRYRWNGSGFVLDYTPLEYPHPRRSGAAPPEEPGTGVMTAVSLSAGAITIGTP